MADDLEQRIQISLDSLTPQDDGCQSCDLECNFTCEPCFIHAVICDMKREREDLQRQWTPQMQRCYDMLLELACNMRREREDLKKQRDVAIKHLAEWCAAIYSAKYSGITYAARDDEWDQYYKDARFNDHALPEIRALLNQAIETATKECQT